MGNSGEKAFNKKLREGGREWIRSLPKTIGWFVCPSWAISFAYIFSYDRKSPWSWRWSWCKEEARFFPHLLPVPDHRPLHRSPASPLEKQRPLAKGCWGVQNKGQLLL